jgi:quercetin dioxygenase-like cupin family protein
MEVWMQYVRIFSDPAGETHFATIEVALHWADFAPPAPPVQLADFTPAVRSTFVAVPAGWEGDWHPAPRRQWFIMLAGTWEVTVSDGEVLRFMPGAAVLVEDTTGKGHITRIVGDEEARAAVVQLPE